MLSSRFRAMLERDIKKIVALSTLSQLGVIVVVLGCGNFLLRFFHLLSHAFFKALLFIRVGRMIHRRNSYQDMRLIGRKSLAKPVTSSYMVISLFSLCGLPFISAFFSKEMILEWIILTNASAAGVGYLYLGVCLTVIYRARLILIVLRSFPRIRPLVFSEDRDSDCVKGIIILRIPARVGGWLLARFLFPSGYLRTRRVVFKLVLLVLIRGLFVVIRVFLSKIKLFKWAKVSWGFGILWIMPFFSADLPVKQISGRGVYYLKFVDRGVVNFFTLELRKRAMKIIRGLSLISSSQLKLMLRFALWGCLLGLIFYLWIKSKLPKKLMPYLLR